MRCLGWASVGLVGLGLPSVDFGCHGWIWVAMGGEQTRKREVSLQQGDRIVQDMCGVVQMRWRAELYMQTDVCDGAAIDRELDSDACYTHPAEGSWQRCDGPQCPVAFGCNASDVSHMSLVLHHNDPMLLDVMYQMYHICRLSDCSYTRICMDNNLG